MSRKHSELLSGGLLLLCGVLLMVASFSIRQLKGIEASMGAAFFPRVGAVLLIVLGGAIAVGGLLDAKRATTEEGERKPLFPLSMGARCVVLTLALFALYALLLEPLGFILSTILYIFLQMVVLSTKDKRRYLLFAIISVATSVVIYFCFVKLFYLMLPAGILG